MSDIKEFKKILVGIDGSDESRKAAHCAIDIAKRYNAEVVAITIHNTNSDVNNKSQRSADEYRKEMEEAREWFNKFNEDTKHNGVNLRIELIATDLSPSTAILQYTESENIDLIIVGTRGRKGFKRLLLGSTASSIVTHAVCTVMIIR